MPTQYPNLDHPQFLYAISSQGSSTTSTSSLPLPREITSLATSDLPRIHDFELERTVLRKEEEREKEERGAKIRRSSNSGAPVGRGMGGGGLGTTVTHNNTTTSREEKESESKEELPSSLAREEEARMTEVLRKSSEEGSVDSGGGVTLAGGNKDVRRAMLMRMKSLTLASEEECGKYLDGAGYNLEQAVQQFYGDH
ncbi:hypothetical protein TrCOL_g8626 [Triparma columacea]|uniref:Uncharacterized protein n=1 Tax=Triparma columacea TaxID=722753 RepID=A0A9W7G9F2_9STRA|nr:hypothetical protein TrCOL_g8626 [Triparma columacea]